MEKILMVIISCFLTTMAIILSVSKLVDEKVTWKNLLKFILILTPLLSISFLFFEGVSKMIISILIFSITLYFTIFQKNIFKSLYYGLIYEIVAAIVEILICVVELVVFKFDFNNYASSSKFILLTSIINLTVVYLLCHLKFIKKLINKIFELISKNKKTWIYVILVTSLIILLISFNWYNFSDNLSFYINIGMIIFVITVLLYIIKNAFQKEKLENNYIEMMEYVQKYEKIINEQGKKNHEYNNQLTVIRGYSNNPKKLEEYLDTIIEDHKCGQNYTIRQLSNFPDGGIKGLIYHKLSKMEDNNIKYYLYIDSESKDIFEEKFDLKTYQDITKLLGVFLDNAIDASKELKNKEIELDIKNEDNCIIIEISNTFNDDIDVKQIGKKGFTTKGKGHGYGLSIVKDINKHNENIETFNDIEDDRFTQTILIYYK